MWCIYSTWNKCMFNGLIHNLTCNQTCARFTSGRNSFGFFFPWFSFSSFSVCAFALSLMSIPKLYVSFFFSRVRCSCVCVWFFLLVNSIQNLHKYIYAFSFMHTEIHVMYHLGYSAFAFAVCLTGTRAARFALAGLLLVDWLAWENNCGLVVQRFHSKFPVNLFEFIYILAAISLHKLLLNIPKLRNLFSFEWTVRALCIALFRFSFSGVW